MGDAAAAAATFANDVRGGVALEDVGVEDEGFGVAFIVVWGGGGGDGGGAGEVGGVGGASVGGGGEGGGVGGDVEGVEADVGDFLGGEVRVEDVGVEDYGVVVG